MKNMFGKTFPKGYIVDITSWENDADHYSNQTLYGLQKCEVEFLKDFLIYFRTASHYKEAMGNRNIVHSSILHILNMLYEQHQEGIELFLKDDKKILEAIPKVTESDDAADDIEDDIHDLVIRLLGEPVEYDYNFVRVFESLKVYYLKEALKIPKLKEIKE